MSQSSTLAPETETGQGKTFLGHPLPLFNLFSIELWERFSFYGMQAILAYYMYYSVSNGGLGLDQEMAVGLVGAYGGGVYLSTILGAWVADRLFGSERVLFYSAVMIMAGHIALALLPGALGLAVGLILVAIGSGGLKANATSIVGSLYRENDGRRDAGFSIFYMGINIGAFVGPLITGWLQTEIGFHWGFGAAAVGMALGLIQYGLTRKLLPAEARVVPNPLPPQRRGLMAGIAVTAVILIALAVLLGLITAQNLKWVVVGVVLIAAISYFWVILSSKKVSSTERSRVYAFIPLFIASSAFWSLYQQQFTVLPVYAEQRLDLNLFGWQIPAAWVQSINPIFIIIFAGVFAVIWTKLGSRQPSSPTKFSISLLVMGVAFLCFMPLSALAPVPLLAIVGILLLFTVAELMTSPVGLSLATKLAPKAFHTQMVALFFLSVSLGSTMSGVLAGYYDPNNELPYFGIIGGLAVVLGIALALCGKPIRRLMAGVH
ncbi:POT family proton-dependent oligopeptide transporter [Psychromicrobium silvestre]|uniref:POT family proton-dependent oligopeptide transporter n=1 Tax=Psychromicrobium silvestre TaxID=1645614 RepID=A0A7Y9LUU2_9MICC|nr:peptide MFS transporter [Psychromicrobium silvestre]NYE96042.1 POT family proton-dependent oligopeptide transporter [Psychromicrobium silvestre]